MDVSRRDLFKFGGIAAASFASAGVLSACSQASTSTQNKSETTVTVDAQDQKSGSTDAKTEMTDNTPSFFKKPEPIKDIKETKEFDVVVVGAGAAGIPAALSAKEQGVSVAVIQKGDEAVSQGNTASSVIINESDPAGVQALISMLVEKCAYLPKREQIDLWANNSYEALKWLWAYGEKAGAQMQDTTDIFTQPIKTIHGYPLKYFVFNFGPKPYNTGNGMIDIAKYAEKELGIEFFYKSAAEQLVKDDSGRVVGVIANTPDGYVQFNAKKGVIVATGDYTNNKEMMQYYEPDMNNIWKKMHGKTGDGQRMMVWAGAEMEPVYGSKVQHDFDGGPASMCDMPFLTVKNSGKRYCDEGRTPMYVQGNFLRSKEDSGWYTQVFDSKYMEDCKDWPGALVDPEGLKNYMPEVEGEKKGVYEALIGTYSANTLEELAQKLEITNPQEFVKTVERYNEMVAQGKDDDFGKDPKWLKSISEPPFYGIHRHIGLSTIIHGVNVNENLQVLDAEGKAIEGLYSIGNCAGNFFGSPDYPMDMPGLSLGRAHTQGYVVGKYVASL